MDKLNHVSTVSIVLLADTIYNLWRETFLRTALWHQLQTLTKIFKKRTHQSEEYIFGAKGLPLTVPGKLLPGGSNSTEEVLSEPDPF